MPNNTVRCGLHLEHLRHPLIPDPTKPDLKSQLGNTDLAKEALNNGITRIGVNLTYGESKALFAVQKMLDDTGYKGNTSPEKLPAGNPQQYGGDVPVLLSEKSEYLEAYGVGKAKSSRQKMEYSSQARRAAMDALHSLAGRTFLFSYDRKFEEEDDKTGKEVQFIGPLIKLQEQDKYLRIVPQPIVVDQIDSYYVPKPVDLYTVVAKGRDGSLVSFIEWILLQYEMTRRRAGTHKYLLRRQSDVVAYAIGLEALIHRRERKALRKRLTDYYEFAKSTGYLKDYDVNVAGSTVVKLDVLQLNATELAKIHDKVAANLGKV